MSSSPSEICARLNQARRAPDLVSKTEAGLQVSTEAAEALSEGMREFVDPRSELFASPMLKDIFAKTLTAITIAKQRAVPTEPYYLLEALYRSVLPAEELKALDEDAHWADHEYAPGVREEIMRKRIIAHAFEVMKTIPRAKRTSNPKFKRMLEINQAHLGTGYIDHHQLHVGAEYQPIGKVDGARLEFVDAIREKFPDAKIELAKKVFFLERIDTVRTDEDGHTTFNSHRFPEELETDVVRVTLHRHGIIGERDYDLP